MPNSARKPIVIVTRKLPDVVETRMRELFDARLNVDDQPMSQGQITEALKIADVLVPTVTDRIDRAVISQAGPQLRLIANFGTGVDNIDLDTARNRGITVTNTPGVLTEDTADMTMALILAVPRRLVEGAAYLKEHHAGWTGWSPTWMLGHRIYGKRLGIIGMGRIGSAVARRAEGFGMKVLWFDPQVDPKTVSDKYERADLRHLCSSSDFISIHVPLTPDTHHLVNSELLSLMRPTAVLINTARGPIVDEEALIKALRDKKIAAAGLDVFENEPEIPAELLELENAVLLPHIGSASIETRTKMALMAAENAIAVIQGTEPPARVN